MHSEQPPDPENIKPRETSEPSTPDIPAQERPFAFGPEPTELPITDVPATEHTLAPYVPSEIDPERIQSQARTLATAESDPFARTQLLGALVSEGDHTMVDLATAALQEIPDTDPEDSSASRGKITAAKIMVQTMADQQQFQAIDTIIGVLTAFNAYEATAGIQYALSKGYAGEADRYLQLDFSAAIDAARAAGRQAPLTVWVYVEGLAAYGQDVSDPHTHAGKLFADCLALQADPATQDYFRDSVAYSYISNGHIRQALAVQADMHDPFWLSNTKLRTAYAAQKQGDTLLADTLIADTQNLMGAVRACNGDCGRPLCNPALDAKGLRVQIARTLALRGDSTGARAFAGTLEPLFASDQAAVHAELYAQTGDTDARVNALTSMVNGSAYRSHRIDGKLIERIGAADQRWGNVIPSFEADGEAVPAICWELHSLYGQKHRTEQEIETQGLDENDYQLMEILDINPTVFIHGIAEIRNELRDNSLARLAKLLAATDAPRTAHHLVGLIETPVEKVRAMAGIAQALRDKY